MDIAHTQVLLGFLFLAASSVAFFTMLHVLGAPHTSRSGPLRLIHRISGWIAVALFVVLAAICVVVPLRATGVPTAPAALHITFAAIFIPLILMKILIVERYPELRNRLFGVSTTLFAVTFVLFFTSSLPRLADEGASQAPALEPANAESLALGRDLFVVKCAKCHRLDRALSARKTPEEWRLSVETMREKDPTWMGESEAERIADFLISLGD